MTLYMSQGLASSSFFSYPSILLTISVVDDRDTAQLAAIPRPKVSARPELRIEFSTDETQSVWWNTPMDGLKLGHQHTLGPGHKHCGLAAPKRNEHTSHKGYRRRRRHHTECRRLDYNNPILFIYLLFPFHQTFIQPGWQDSPKTPKIINDP